MEEGSFRQLLLLRCRLSLRVNGVDTDCAAESSLAGVTGERSSTHVGEVGGTAHNLLLKPR